MAKWKEPEKKKGPLRHTVEAFGLFHLLGWAAGLGFWGAEWVISYLLWW